MTVTADQVGESGVKVNVLETFAKAIMLPRLGSIVQGIGQHIAVAFMPRRIVDLGNNSLYVSVGRVKAVEETHRIEAVPEVS